MGDVRYCRLAMEEMQEDVAGVCSVAVDLLCGLLGQAAHHTLYPAYRMLGVRVPVTKKVQTKSLRLTYMFLANN